jgi:hypothetical protein
MTRCGRATVREHDEVRYILAPQGCDRPHRCQAGILWLGSPPSQAAEEIRAKIARTKAALDTATDKEKLVGLQRLNDLKEEIERLEELRKK